LARSREGQWAKRWGALNYEFIKQKKGGRMGESDAGFTIGDREVLVEQEFLAYPYEYVVSA
jgi:hypothetical protein